MSTSDLEAGEHRRDQGMARVKSAEAQRNPGWSRRALRAIENLAFDIEYFTTDDLKLRFAERPKSPKAWGPVWGKAKRLKLVELAINREKPKSAIPSQNAHRLDVYHSLIFLG